MKGLFIAVALILLAFLARRAWRPSPPEDVGRIELSPPERSSIRIPSASGRKLIDSHDAAPAASQTASPRVTGPTRAERPDLPNPAPRPIARDAAPLEALKTLADILRSNNDNDPRLDRDFNDLSPETKRLFRLKYRRLPRERFNARGTIVYLLGNNLRSDEDWAFLRDVVSEPPCLSLADCAKEPPPTGERAPGEEVSLAYPGLVALRQAERAHKDAWEGNTEPADTMQELLNVIQAAKNSRISRVADMAAKLERQHVRQGTTD